MDAANPGNTLYVTGLSSRVTERNLEDHFAREGKVSIGHIFSFVTVLQCLINFI